MKYSINDAATRYTLSMQRTDFVETKVPACSFYTIASCRAC